ncbi:class I SAM-dependent methyltransferase [Streptomyces sp. NPDC032198]|uniref:class I SAM-dependent methyltransferase n=1 Tax=Streptomyces sp. NPDC032198 TaxID=3155127 RepID=UPI0033CA846F
MPLDLGPARGREASYLARQGTEVTGVDLSRLQVERARAWWSAEPRLRFVQSDACDFLREDDTAYHAIYSVWGAVWFTDPDALLPLIAGRLAPGGILALSHAEPANGAYGPQAMGGKYLEGRRNELTVLRWQYPPRSWHDLLKRHGFARVEASVLAAPEAGKLGTLMVTARRGDPTAP